MSKDAEVIDWLVGGGESKVKGKFLMNVKNGGKYINWRKKVRIERKITGRRKWGQVLRGGDSGLYFFIKNILFCSIVDLQCCKFLVHSKIIQVYIHIYIYIHILFHIIFHYSSLQDIEYSSLHYTVGPLLFIYLVYIHLY